MPRFINFDFLLKQQSQPGAKKINANKKACTLFLDICKHH